LAEIPMRVLRSMAIDAIRLHIQRIRAHLKHLERLGIPPAEIDRLEKILIELEKMLADVMKLI